MTRWWRRGAADGVPAAVRSAEALRAVLDNAPAVLLVADEAGDIVYRNKAAEELLRQTAATGGQKVLLALRDSLKDDIRTARSFPSVKTTPLTVDGRTMYGSSTLTRIPGGYVVTWPVSKCLASLRRAQTTTGRVGVSSGYNTGIQTKRRLAGSPPGPRLGSTEHFETGPSTWRRPGPAPPPNSGRADDKTD